MKKFEAGDKVFDMTYGNGIVRIIEQDSDNYPVKVDFTTEDGKNTWESYMLDGKAQSDHIRPLLYHGHDLIVKIEQPIYEYQIVYKRVGDPNWSLSYDYYLSAKDYLIEIFHAEFRDLYEAYIVKETKRLRNEDNGETE